MGILMLSVISSILNSAQNNELIFYKLPKKIIEGLVCLFLF